MRIDKIVSTGIVKPLNLTTRIFDWLAPLNFFAIRIWLFKEFFMSGLNKIQSWQSTIFLFEHEYNVPLISPHLAAISGTAAELLLPVLLLLGIGARLPAFGLFIFNIVAVYAYQSFLFSGDSASGLNQHILWGFMILSIMAHGHDKFSIDYLLHKICPKYRY